MRNAILVIGFMMLSLSLYSQNSVRLVLNEPVVPYKACIYKIAEVVNDLDRYETIIQVYMQGDANYFNQQAHYEVRIEKFEGTSGRFDGFEVRCITGNPFAATFFIFNNAIWVKPTYTWGALILTWQNFLPSNPIPSNITTNYVTDDPGNSLAVVNGHGLKYDFDNNISFKLPYFSFDGGSVFYGNVGIGINTPSGKLAVKSINGGILVDEANSGNNFYDASEKQAFRDMAGNVKMVINSATGNVGIGTVNPTQRLSVNGTVLAKKIKVTTNAGDWPDYVFKPDYRLRSLESLETFIKKYQHLPELPSAQAINDEGHSIGDMQILLLRKIEELTLYILQQQKQIENLKRSIKKKQRFKKELR